MANAMLAVIFALIVALFQRNLSATTAKEASTARNVIEVI
jgi:hypothetical protein